MNSFWCDTESKALEKYANVRLVSHHYVKVRLSNCRPIWQSASHRTDYSRKHASDRA